MTFDPDEFGAQGPVIRDKRRIDPVTGEVRERPDAAPATSPPGDGGSPSNPEMAQAAADISAAIQALKNAQRDGDFEGQGRALADLQAAVDAYQAAQQSAASPSPASATPTG